MREEREGRDAIRIETLKHVMVVSLEFGFETLWALHLSKKIPDSYRAISEEMDIPVTYLFSKTELQEKILDSTKAELKKLELRLEAGEDLQKHELSTIQNYKDRIKQLEAEQATEELD